MLKNNLIALCLISFSLMSYSQLDSGIMLEDLNAERSTSYNQSLSCIDNLSSEYLRSINNDDPDIGGDGALLQYVVVIVLNQ